MVRGEHDEALRLLEGLREAAEASERKGNLLEILVLQALALWATNEKERAVTTLTRALVLAEPEGYVRTFADEGAAMGDLLRSARRSTEGPPRRHAQRPDAVPREAPGGPRARGCGAGRRASGSPNPERARAGVLAPVAAGMSNKEIAGRLFVSVTTVKTHINNLYRKLGARSRTQAIARARELDLI